MPRHGVMIAKLIGGPHDSKLVRMEGEVMPSILLFGWLDPDEQDCIMAYVAKNAYRYSQEWNSDHSYYQDFLFTGQCPTEALPMFLWGSDD